MRKCKGCPKDISHKHPNAKFCGQRCKDNYWNRENPRGLGLELNNLIADAKEDSLHSDGSWDEHQCYTVDQENRDNRISALKARMAK